MRPTTAASSHILSLSSLGRRPSRAAASPSPRAHMLQPSIAASLLPDLSYWHWLQQWTISLLLYRAISELLHARHCFWILLYLYVWKTFLFKSRQSLVKSLFIFYNAFNKRGLGLSLDEVCILDICALFGQWWWSGCDGWRKEMACSWSCLCTLELRWICSPPRQPVGTGIQPLVRNDLCQYCWIVWLVTVRTSSISTSPW